MADQLLTSCSDHFSRYLATKASDENGSKVAYEALLSFTLEVLGDQSRDILAGVVDEVLVTLKDDTLSRREKKRETERVLGAIAEERFSVLVKLEGEITDHARKDESIVQFDNIEEEVSLIHLKI